MRLDIRRMAVASDGSRRYYDTLVRIEAKGDRLPHTLIAYGWETCEALEGSGETVALFINGRPECCSPFRR